MHLKAVSTCDNFEIALDFVKCSTKVMFGRAPVL